MGDAEELCPRYRPPGDNAWILSHCFKVPLQCNFTCEHPGGHLTGTPDIARSTADPEGQQRAALRIAHECALLITTHALITAWKLRSADC